LGLNPQTDYRTEAWVKKTQGMVYKTNPPPPRPSKKKKEKQDEKSVEILRVPCETFRARVSKLKVRFNRRETPEKNGIRWFSKTNNRTGGGAWSPTHGAWGGKPKSGTLCPAPKKRRF